MNPQKKKKKKQVQILANAHALKQNIVQLSTESGSKSS